MGGSALRVLIVRVGAMGDVLHALPAVTALRRALPEAEIGWAIEPRWRALLEDGDRRRPVVDAVHAVDTRLWKRRAASLATVQSTLQSIRGLRRELRAGRYDVCVDLQGSVRSAAIGRMAGAGRFVGSAKAREGPARWLYGEVVDVEAVHVIGQAAELLSAGVGQALAPVRAELPVDARGEDWWAATATGIGEGPVVLLAPQAGWGAKQWPAERFGGVARVLAEAGCRVLVNAVGEGDAVAAAVAAASGGAALPMRMDVAELIALTRRAALVIAGDTGPLHLASALGRPVVALFGPTDPARTGPLGGASGEMAGAAFGGSACVLRHPASVTDHRRYTETEGGLLQITTERVAEAALALLREQRP